MGAGSSAGWRGRKTRAGGGLGMLVTSGGGCNAGGVWMGGVRVGGGGGWRARVDGEGGRSGGGGGGEHSRGDEEGGDRSTVAG